MTDKLLYGFFVIIEEGDRRLHRHACEEDAIREQERLARANPGKVFYRLSTECAAEVSLPAVEFTKATPPTTLPF